MLVTHRKKLIEVSLPLEDINKASAREKSIRHGHPSTLHLWWARRPLAACRAVLFAQLVDDPSAWPDRFPTEAAQAVEREKLHDLIRRLVPWKASHDEAVLNEARWHIARSVAWGKGQEPPSRDDPQAVLGYLQAEAPPVYDPFCGGGSIPLEAQRLGLRAIASDLNPVAVMITKALVEFPPRFKDQAPVNPESRRQLPVGGWKGARGLAEDVRYYGRWMRDEAERRIGHLYPRAKLEDGSEATVIAWLWARTAKSPNPAANGAMVPLVSSFMLSTKEGRQAWVEPVLDGSAPDGYRFEVRNEPKDGEPPLAAKQGTKAGRGANFTCVLTSSPITPDHIKAEGRAGRMGARLMAIVAEGARSRVYLAPADTHERIATSITKPDGLDESLPYEPRAIWCTLYGLERYRDLFTPRQLVALTTFSDLVAEARERALADASAAGLDPDPTPLADGGRGAVAYADALAVYLAFAVDRQANRSSNVCFWHSGRQTLEQVFARQAIPMVWDFAEGNPCSGSSGSWLNNVEWVEVLLANLRPKYEGHVSTRNAANGSLAQSTLTAATDPPYYDNIGYADLSDFFYVWMRRTIGSLFPDEFATILVPKEKELIASPYRHGSREKAEAFFMAGMRRALINLDTASVADPPLTIFYAFKQVETKNEGVVSTGWATFLEAVLDAGFGVDGTWPVRTELAGNLKKRFNALASSIVLVCRKRSTAAATVTRVEFLRALKRELPPAVRMLQATAIAPVDLAQAAIGPGMAVFSRYAAVLESDDTRMPVKTALALINQELDAILASEDVDYDGWTRFAVAWFEQHGHEAAGFGVANVLANAKAVGINGVVQTGIAEARAGKVRLLRRDELPDDWNPAEDSRLTIWEAVQHLIRRHEARGVEGAAALLALLPGAVADAARELAYRLYQVCERKRWAQEALPYNALVADWPEIQRCMAGRARPGPAPQPGLPFADLAAE